MPRRLSAISFLIPSAGLGFGLATLTLPVSATDPEPRPAAAEVAASTPIPLDPVHVRADAPDGYHTRSTRSATRTDTRLVDIPQAISVIPRERVADQSAQNLGDVLRYTAGVGIAQGEGHRDAPILRGNTSTADLFLNGLRDDVQYLRDLYNIERIDVLKGSSALLFGRGGTGGVINRVTRMAEGDRTRELAASLGSFEHRRLTADVGDRLNTQIDGRVTAVYENSGSYRDDVKLERSGLNPSLGLALGPATHLTLGAEVFHDHRTTDRGIPSQNGRPFITERSRFFGNPEASHSSIDAHTLTATLDHRFGPATQLRNSTLLGRYDKFYDNVFAATPVASNGTVGFDAYSSATARTNLFNQTDLVLERRTGPLEHTLLLGVELGRQTTDNLRLTGRFADGPDADSNPDTRFFTTVANSNFRNPVVDFMAGATDGNNRGTAETVSVYAQDQLTLSPVAKAIIGLRLERFTLDFINRRADAGAHRTLQSEDSLISPRIGLLYQPAAALSFYGSYSVSALPRAGEQLASLTPSNQSLAPERYRNLEVGAKWELGPALGVSAALYQLDRRNVLLVNPAQPATALLGNGARSQGLELELAGRISRRLSLAAGYAWQRGQLTGTSNTATARDGALLAQTPRHTGSLWGRYDFSHRWGAGLGMLARSGMFATTSNAVRLPGYVRSDAAVFWKATRRLHAQLNAENLLGTRILQSAHNDNNLMPGGPLTLRATLTAAF